MEDDIIDQVIYEDGPQGLRGPFSHNIIGLVLAEIDKTYGRKAANHTILELGLDDLGWSTQPAPKRRSGAGKTFPDWYVEHGVEPGTPEAQAAIEQLRKEEQDG